MHIAGNAKGRKTAPWKWFQDCTFPLGINMTEGSILAFGIDEPPPAAARKVRRALEQHGLRVAAEVDVAARIKQELGAGVAPCIVLYVDDPALLLEAVIFQRAAALMIPQPLVLSGANRHTEVLVRSAESLMRGGAPASVRDPLANMHARMVRAMESVADWETSRSPLYAGN